MDFVLDGVCFALFAFTALFLAGPKQLLLVFTDFR